MRWSAGSLALADMQNQPRMNTDLHGWESGMQRRHSERDEALPLNGSPASLSDPCSIRVSSVAQESSTRKATTSLTMIVKDEEHNISKCLSSVAGLFDEIVVVDTGSKDRTREIAREFGARVFDFVWVDDFAAARNAALARATGDYAFWLDADDVIDPPQSETSLRRLLDTLAAGRAGRLRREMFLRSGGRTAMAGRRSSIISGCFRFARTCAGRTGCTSRSCRPCGGRTCR